MKMSKEYIEEWNGRRNNEEEEQEQWKKKID